MPLQLLRLLPSRRTKNRVWLILSNRLKLPFSLDDAVSLHLSPGLEIDLELFSQLKSHCLYYLLYNYSLNQVALSPKIEKVISPKIRQKLYFYQKKYLLDGDYQYLIDQVIDKLNSQNLLDKLSFAHYLLRKNQHRSRNYLQRLFSYYHLSLPETYLSHDIETIKNILLKKKYSSLNLLENSAKNKLFASLARKGFAYDDIKTAIDELDKEK